MVATRHLSGRPAVASKQCALQERRPQSLRSEYASQGGAEGARVACICTTEIAKGGDLKSTRGEVGSKRLQSVVRDEGCRPKPKLTALYEDETKEE